MTNIKNKNKSFFYASSLLCVIAFSTFIAPDAKAKMYQWVDDKGVTHFTKEPPPEKYLNNKLIKADSNRTQASKVYLAERNALMKKISMASNVDRRKRLEQELNNLDLRWYDKYDPEQARQLREKLGQTKVKVIKKEQKTNMDQFKAFY